MSWRRLKILRLIFIVQLFSIESKWTIFFFFFVVEISKEEDQMSWKRTCNVIDRVRDELSNVTRTLTAKCKLTNASKNDDDHPVKSIPDCNVLFFFFSFSFVYYERSIWMTLMMMNDFQFFTFSLFSLFYSFPFVRTSAYRYWYSNWKWNLLSCSRSNSGRRNSKRSHRWFMFGATVQAKSMCAIRLFFCFFFSLIKSNLI